MAERNLKACFSSENNLTRVTYRNCISPTQTFQVCEIELRALGENASFTARFNLSASS